MGLGNRQFENFLVTPRPYVSDVLLTGDWNRNGRPDLAIVQDAARVTTLINLGE
jgi:hypothetical protein